MKDTINKKVLKKSFIPQGGKETKFSQKSWTWKDRMDEETRREISWKTLCFNFKYMWEQGHRCMGKGKFNYIEVVYVGFGA
jgi:hypothetical protein